MRFATLSLNNQLTNFEVRRPIALLEDHLGLTLCRTSLAHFLNKTGNVCITYHWGAFVQPLLQWTSNKWYILCVCVCSLRYPACNAHAPYYRLWQGSLYSIFPHYLYTASVSKKKWTQNVCFDFLYSFCLKHYSFQKELSEIWSKQIYIHIRIHVIICFFLGFNEIWIFRADFRKIIQYKIS